MGGCFLARKVSLRKLTPPNHSPTHAHTHSHTYTNIHKPLNHLHAHTQQDII